MMPRVIEIDAAKEMRALGCDETGIKLMAPKAVLRVIKLRGLRPAAANIIKQEMLSFGGDAATAYGTVNFSVKATDLLIFGTIKQFRLLIEKLKMHQFGLPEVSRAIDSTLRNYASTPRPMRIGPRTLDLGLRTHVMGILNITPDSFYDGGKFFDPRKALSRAEKMVEEGADIIDVGGESTRPGAKPVPVKEEIERVVPVILTLSKNRKAVISIDTRKAAVAQAALEAGAHMVNDVSGLCYDKKMAKLIGRYKVPVCVMHMRGNPRSMQKNPSYFDLMGEVIEELEESLAIAKNAGILHEKIMVDPGIGFGKSVENNLEILRRLRELKVLGRPILVGPSRKSTIGKVLDLPVEERLEGTAAAVAVAVMNGADLVRVHDVKEMGRVVRMADAIVRRR
jgi:dihydropteroate synthase